jgi:2',3'-cyclic-nucleotide 2'-phosphodiesterase (5'-nucleotidase family)
MRQAGGFIDWWGDRHLASNIVMAGSGEAFSNQFLVLEGTHSTVLVFGFIYHLEDPAPEVVVLDPADVVKAEWFSTALRSNPHSAVLVMAHMGTDDDAVRPILDAIRHYDGEKMPVQFVAGHTHLRRWLQLDTFAKAVESGRYLDTVAFISFPNAETVDRTEQQGLFQHEFVDANVDNMKVELRTTDDFSTDDGRALTNYILRTKSQLGLNEVLGCAPDNYYVNRSLEEHDAIWAIYRDQVVPSQLNRDNGINQAIIISQASWRYDLFAGENTYDDVVAVSPFNEPIFLVGAMPCDIVLSLNKTMNDNMTSNFYQALPAYILSGTVIPGEACELHTHHFELNSIIQNLALLHPEGRFEVQATRITSTTIWTNFVRSKWLCVDQNGSHTRLPHDFNILHDDGKTSKPNQFILPLTLGAMVITLCCCWRTKIHAETPHTSDDEMDAFNDDNEIDSDFT